MGLARKILLGRIGNDVWDNRLAEWSAYAAALTVFVVGMPAVPERAANRWELLVGMLAVLTLDVVLLVLGLVAGMRKPDSTTTARGAN